MQICTFIFWKALLQIASQNFPELNALNFLFVKVKDMGLPDSQKEINLVIYHLNYILIHLNILPYSVLNWEYLKMSALGTTLMTVSIFDPISLKCDQFSLNSPNFQQWNPNLHIIFQIIVRFKTGVFVFGLWAILKNIESLDSILL